VSTGPYRGAGRPEANYCLERLVDEAARITGIAFGLAAARQHRKLVINA
jgi:CO/xanthine dehydrogenase Mo-binding subunit